MSQNVFARLAPHPEYFSTPWSAGPDRALSIGTFLPGPRKLTAVTAPAWGFDGAIVLADGPGGRELYRLPVPTPRPGGAVAVDLDLTFSTGVFVAGLQTGTQFTLAELKP